MVILTDGFFDNYKGDLDSLKSLIESDRSILGQVSSEGNNILMVCLVVRTDFLHRRQPKDKEIFEYLLQSGVNLNHFNNDNKNALMMSMKCSAEECITQILIDSGADAFLKNSETNQSFYDYLMDGNWFILRHVKMIEYIYKHEIKKQKQYYEELIEQELQKQKEKLLEELYQPNGIGYTMAKERFEKN